MSKEFKAIHFSNIKAKADGRTRVGVAAVFGNVDDWGDRIQPGAFKKTIAEGLNRVRHLWNHDGSCPPIATILELRELSRDELPEEVLEKSPEASGGLLVKREYYKNDLANWVLEAVDKGDVNEMSFAYDVVKSVYATEEIEGTDRSREIRELLELRLYDTSDVNWGMNSATVAAGAKNAQIPLGLIYSNLLNVENQIKAGRRNSDSDQKLLDLIHETICDLGAVCESKAEEEGTEDEKSETAEEPKAEAVEDDTSLSNLNARFQKLQIEKLKI